jgi:ATP-binding cassette subfamily B protein
MVVFSSYAVQVIMAFMMLTMIFVLLPRASVSAKRVNEVLLKNLSIKDGKVVKPETQTDIAVEFRNVSFKYPDAEDYVVEGINFTVKKGETAAFIGGLGSGKSTVVNLIPRFYDASGGEVLVDGVNVKEYNLHALRNKLGYVSQKAVMFSGTVESNITFGTEFTAANRDGRKKSAQIKKAAEISQAAEFVENMDDKYSSAVSQGGANLSGGQKQRLSIARAVYKKPEINIFDDSFSALDYKTDRTLRTALKKELADTTCLIVSQRIGTIKDADKIVVLDGGKQVGAGTHKELLENCEVYREIAYSQLSKEELEKEL